MSFANTSCSLCLSSLDIAFCREVFNFNNVCLSIIYSMNCTFGGISKISSPFPRPSIFSPMLSSRSFISLSLFVVYSIGVYSFRSVIHFELIFAKGIRSRFILLHVDIYIACIIEYVVGIVIVNKLLPVRSVKSKKESFYFIFPYF